jgi:HemY protein
MIRAAFALFVIAVLILAVMLAATGGQPGDAVITWLGWEVRTTAVAAVLLILASALAAMLLWRTVIWLVEAPRRSARAREETRRRQGAEALARGFLAVASGDGPEARRLAGRAAGLAEDSPQLVRILAAQAAEAAGDTAAARAAYTAMLGFPEMRLAAHRGLRQLALDAGDAEEALRHASAAYALARTAPWAWRAVLDAALARADWPAALAIVQGALERKIVSPLIAERARAALQAASAAGLDAAADPRRRAEALALVQAAAKARPDFSPGVVVAARLLAGDGKVQRAAQGLETAWKVRPHPALWLAYRDLRTDETPAQRAQRLAGLAALNADHRESRILMVEQALIAGDAAVARAGAQALAKEPLTARLAALFARAAAAAGDRDEARAWIARGQAAPLEPDWSDLDPEGPAFAYAPADWARLVATYAESGELIHPRHERHERSLNDLPAIPAAYALPAPLLAEADGLPGPIVDDSDFADDLQPATPPDPPVPTVPGRRTLGARAKSR